MSRGGEELTPVPGLAAPSRACYCDFAQGGVSAASQRGTPATECVAPSAASLPSTIDPLPPCNQSPTRRATRHDSWALLVSEHVSRCFTLEQTSITVGRGAGCDVVVLDPRVSVRHFTIYLERELDLTRAVPRTAGGRYGNRRRHRTSSRRRGGVRNRNQKPATGHLCAPGASPFESCSHHDEWRAVGDGVTEERTNAAATTLRVMLEDHSTNGTYVNEVRVGKGRRCELRSGDDIAIVALPEKRSAESATSQAWTTPGTEGGTYLEHFCLHLYPDESVTTATPHTVQRDRAASRSVPSPPSTSSAVARRAVRVSVASQLTGSQAGRQLVSDVSAGFIAPQHSPSPQARVSSSNDMRGAVHYTVTARRALQWGPCVGSGTSGRVYLGIDVASSKLIAIKVLRQTCVGEGDAKNATVSSSHCPDSPTQDEGGSTILSVSDVSVGRATGVADAAMTTAELAVCGSGQVVNVPVQLQRAHLRELWFLTQLQHHRIVRCLGFQREKGRGLCILMEYVAGGTLQSLIKSFGAFDENVIRLYTVQILEGLEYLHRCHVVHGDLKSANVLVSERGNVKLTDFGTSRVLRDLAASDTPVASRHSPEPNATTTPGVLCGTPLYMSPELIRTQCSTFASDVWALGCIVFEMATGGVLPWREVHQLDVCSILYHIGNQTSHGPSFADLYTARNHSIVTTPRPTSAPTLHEDRLDHTRARHCHSNPTTPVSLGTCTPPTAQPTPSPPLLDFLRAMLELDPTRRPTVSELLMHPFILDDPSTTAGTHAEPKRTSLALSSVVDEDVVVHGDSVGSGEAVRRLEAAPSAVVMEDTVPCAASTSQESQPLMVAPHTVPTRSPAPFARASRPSVASSLPPYTSHAVGSLSLQPLVRGHAGLPVPPYTHAGVGAEWGKGTREQPRGSVLRSHQYYLRAQERRRRRAQSASLAGRATATPKTRHATSRPGYAWVVGSTCPVHDGADSVLHENAQPPQYGVLSGPAPGRRAPESGVASAYSTTATGPGVGTMTWMMDQVRLDDASGVRCGTQWGVCPTRTESRTGTTPPPSYAATPCGWGGGTQSVLGAADGVRNSGAGADTVPQTHPRRCKRRRPQAAAAWPERHQHARRPSSRKESKETVSHQ